MQNYKNLTHTLMLKKIDIEEKLKQFFGTVTKHIKVIMFIKFFL